ncbi:MAG: ribosomal protein S1p [Myxococcaceae bacterium]|nr:ribosomal protein S1p [Myxococcaceae bacterium]
MSDPSKAPDDFAALFEQSGGVQKRSGPAVKVGARVEAIIVQITRDAVFVDLDQKRQAYMDRAEILGPDGQPTMKVGDKLVAHVLEMDPKSGSVRLGKTLGKGGDVGSLELAREQGISVEAKVVAVNKGGVELEVNGMKAFCPTSQLDNRFVQDPTTFIGKTYQFKVTEIREGGRSIVLSRRAHLEVESREAMDRLMTTLAPGAVVKGTVTGVRDFGAFVDLGGVEGLVPASELSHDSHVRPSDIVSVGDAMEVQVKEIRGSGRDTKITLSLKALSGDPWDAIEVVAPVGRVVAGAVTRLADFGAFVRLGSGIEGLLHVSELPGRVDHPSKVLAEGQAILVVIRSVDRATKKISLALAADGATAGAAAQAMSLPVGTIVKATVDRHETFGIFVQVEGSRGRAGRGLIPMSELGVPRGADLRKLFPEGASVTAKVLETGEGRLRMSIRAIGADEERAAYDGYQRTTKGPGKTGATLGDLLKARVKK